MKSKLEQFVIDRQGKWFTTSECFKSDLVAAFTLSSGEVTQISVDDIGTISSQEFETTAKRMGYINGYRWGLEYATNGKRPDLPDTLLVKYQHKTDGEWLNNPFPVDGWAWEETSKAFKIVDEAYKPADTSYLNALSNPESLTHSEEGLTHSEWHERGELPPAGSEIEVFTEHEEVRAIHVVWSGDNVAFGYDLNAPFVYAHFSALAYKFRPVRTEREKFIDAATAAAIIGDDKSVKLNPCITAAFERLFDSGFRGPKVEK